MAEPDDRRSQMKDALRAALAALDDDVSGLVMNEDITAMAAAVADAATPDLEARFLLGWWHWTRFKAMPSPDDQVEFEQAMEQWEPVASATPEAFPAAVLSVIETHAVEQLSDLAMGLVDTYEQTRDEALLDEAVEVFRAVVRATPTDHLHRGRYLSDLGVTLHLWFEATGDRAALDEAVTTLGDAVDALPDEHPHLTNLGSALLDRFGRFGDVASLDEAVATFGRAAETMPADHPDLAACLSSFGDALRLSFEHTGNRAALDEAIEVGRRSVLRAGADMGMCLSNLGSALHTKFTVTGDEKVLEEAIDYLGRAVEAADDSDLASYLSNLGGALYGRFRRTGQVPALDQAVRTLRRAVAAARDDDPNLSAYLSNLGSALLDEFHKTGKAPVLDETLDVLRRAVATTSQNDPNLGERLSNLCAALQTSHEVGGDTAVLTEAVDVGRRAVTTTRAGDHNLATHLSNLGNALRNTFDRTEAPAALDEAVATYRRAVEITAADHADLGMYLTNLGVALRREFEHSGDPAALDEAEDVLRQAVAAIHDRHPYTGMYLANLANALLSKFESTQDISWLDEAIDLHRTAAGATDQHTPDHGGHLFNLGCALWARHEHTGDREVLDEARKSLAQAWSIEAAPLDVRISSADRAADVDLAAGDPGHALLMAERAVALLGLLAPRRLRRSDRGHRITSLAGIAATAATAAVAAGEPERAVELLEQSRGLLITETLDTRGDLTTLRRRAPGLATEFSALREELDTIDHSASVNAPEVRDKVLDRWDGLLARIRATPGMAGFLRPPSIQDLRRAAVDGPVVYVVVHQHSSHAIVLAHDSVTAVALPGLTTTAMYGKANLFRLAIHTATDEESSAEQEDTARSQVRQVLAWLWEMVAGPVLDHLGHTTPPPAGAEWPRIWWCPVGGATFLPLHAAGHHPETRAGVARSVDTVMDRVISSYTPTARALLHTASTSAPLSPRILVVAATGTPDSAALPSVAAEVELLRDLVPAATVLPRPGHEATSATVLDALPVHTIVHFACHGVSDWHDPTASHLDLDDQTDPLTVSDVTALHLTEARMAYLSACSTADTNPRHADEATHLTSAFYLAGYRAVIGSLWPVGDLAARLVAHDTYRYLTRNGTMPPDTARAVHALHHAVRCYREFRPTHVIRWAAHIHAGR